MRKFKSPFPSSAIDDKSIFQGMLLEDINSSIIPITGTSPLRIAIDPSDKTIEDLVIEGFGGRRYADDLHDTITALVRNCAYELCASGKCYCHIRIIESITATNNSPSPTSAEKKFQVTLLKSSFIKKSFLNLYQSVRDPIDFTKMVWELIPANELVMFDLNEINYGELLNIYPILNHIDKQSHSLPEVDNYTKQFQWKVPPIEKTKLLRTSLAYFTSSIGWNARTLLAEYSTNYYWIYRELKFEEFLSSLRAYIFKQLSKCLQKACENLKIEAEFAIEDPRTVEHIVDLRRQLNSGRKISDIYKDLMGTPQ